MRESISDLEDRFVTLEKRCEEFNADIEALQKLVAASQQGDYIKSVNPVTEDGKSGYEIEFAKNGTITIFNGRDGQDGADGVDVGTTPDISIRKDTDDVYYWTLNGEWLLDDAGNKIKAVANDGAPGSAGVQGPQGEQGAAGEQGPKGEDGVTPVLKIEDGYWYVSYDGGKTFQTESLGKATGENGKDGAAGGDSIFRDVKDNGSYVNFILTDGTVFTLQKSAASALNITFDVEQGVAIVPGTTLKVRYTVTGGDEDVLVRVLMADWQVGPAVKPVDPTSGYLYIYVDSDADWSHEEVYDEDMFGDNVTEGDVLTSYMTVLVSVSDGSGNSALKALNITPGKLVATQDAFLAEAVAGTVTASVNTNVTEGSYTVSIPNSAQSWLSYQPVTRAAMRTDELKFRVTANEGSKFRSAPVALKNEMGQNLGSFLIVQKSYNAQEVVEFADPVVKEVCVARFDKDDDGNLTYEELAVVTDVKGLFDDNRNITSFDEFQYFTSVTVIPEEMFMECSGLESIVLPESVTVIESSAFSGCRSLTSIDLHEGLLEIKNSAFRYSGLEGLLVIPESIEYLGRSAFGDTNISAAHISSENVPSGKYEESSFDPGMTVYVPDQSVEKYRNSYSYRDCNIVPASLMDCSLGISAHMAARAAYSEDKFFFPLNVTVSGDISKFGDIEEFGYYYAISRRWSETDEFTYVQLTSAGTPVEHSLEVPYDNGYVYDESEYMIAFMAKIGAYVTLKDGTVIKYGQKEQMLVYDQYLTLDLVSVEEASVSDGILSFTINYDAGGMFFLDRGLESWYWKAAISDKSGTSPAGPFKDGKGQNNQIEIKLPSSEITETLYMTLVLMNKYEVNVSETVMFTINPDGTASAEIGGALPEMTIADFLDQPEGDTYYQISGMITNIKNVFYGNLVLADQTGEVYVYGLNADVPFEELGLKTGDMLTIKGKRASYRGVPQVTSATYVSHEVGEMYETPVYDVTVEEFLMAEVSFCRPYRLTGTVTEIVDTNYGNLYLTDDTGTVYLYGVRESIYASNTSFANIGLNEGDVVTVIGYRDVYKETPQMTDVYYTGSGSSTEDLSKYSVRFLVFEQTWTEYAYVEENTDAPGYHFFHGLKTGVEADDELLAKSTEIGVYCLYGEDYKYSTTIPLNDGEVTDTWYLWFTQNFYSPDIANYRASYDIYVGTYAKLEDGTTLTFNQQSYTLCYDTKPEITIGSSVRELISTKTVPEYEYTLDDTGMPVDSVAVGDRLLYTYRDSINFKVVGAPWIADIYYARQYDDKTLYNDLGNGIGDNSWNWTPARTEYEEDLNWKSEYILYWDAAAGEYRTSVNQLAVNWYDSKCSLDVLNKTPEDSYVTGVETKSLVGYGKPVTARISTKISMTNVEAVDKNKFKPHDMKRTL